MRTRTTAKVGKKVTTALLALSMAVGTVPFAPGVALADAGDKSLGTSGITVQEKWDKTGGSYVYYGNTPTKYRVLKKDADAMLLDCDSILETKAFDESRTTNVWANSPLRDYLNDETYLNKMFNAAELGAIRDTSITDAGTSTDKVFLLSTGEANGYYADDSARVKTGGYGSWWLRSAGTDPDYPCAAIVLGNGYVYSYGYPVDIPIFGVSPAFNVNLSSVIFSSKISGQEYKLTLKDDSLNVSGSATLNGTTATVTYTSDATQASYLVTDKAWTDSGWPTDATKLDYGKLGEAPSGSGVIDLGKLGLSAEDWGTDYHVYLLAETVSDGNKTDYASAPKEVEKGGTVTFKVQNGSWDDGTKDDRSVTLLDTEKACALTEDQIPAVGSKPQDDYEAGKWDETPSAGTTITSDKTYTYSYAKKSQPTPDPEPTPTPTPGAEIVPAGAGHVQGTGDAAAAASGRGVVIGTTGESRRLEQISLSLPAGTDGGIEYRAHLQGTGWTEFVADGAACGTTGQSRRMEAVQLRLTGTVAETHSVWYRVHSQTLGWLGWAKDGEAAGTAGQSKRAEAVEVQVLPKGEAPEGYEAGQASYVGAATADVHLQRTGWAGARSALSFGTTGQSRRLEAMKLTLANQPLEGGISYAAHLQGTGWTGTVSDGALAGTTGQARRLEAVQVSLTGELANSYSVWYRVHSQTLGWLGWACDGATAGTTGLSKRAEAIEVQILPAGQLPAGYDASVDAAIEG